ncbi:zinc-finger of mitochondrial splicing suppressor 51-domain-containing protein [Hysterangium stoloniferum]|nr:zinc-finger of mitochondrial splicing suppressor 51-domain-containing protein [Hysterangium stoloniferum]
MQCSRRRNIFRWIRKSVKQSPNSSQNSSVLEDDELFRPLSSSSFPDLRSRANTIKKICRCPFCVSGSRLSPKNGQVKLVAFDCPNCGYPTHCSEQHWKEDREHDKYCGKLREVNEDDNDLRSRREKVEYELPAAQPYEEAISFSNWDMFWYTRGFRSMDSERMRRHASKLLTYPLTIGSILHRHSYLTTRNQRLTPEGARSLAALRTTVHVPVGGPETPHGAIGRPPTRIFVLGARAESALPPHVWSQLCYLFPSAIFQIYFIGPQVALPKEATRSTESADTEEDKEVSYQTSDSKAAQIYEPPTPTYIGSQSSRRRLRALTVSSGIPSYTLPHTPFMNLTALRSSYTEAIHEELGPFDPYTDLFVLYSPGLGFPSPTTPNTLQISAPKEWGGVIPMLLSTRCPIFLTAFSPADIERDVRAMEETEGIAGEFEWIITPGKNEFGSEKWEVADFDLRVMVKLNWAVWAVRGKTREVRDTARSWWY